VVHCITGVFLASSVSLGRICRWWVHILSSPAHTLWQQWQLSVGVRALVFFRHRCKSWSFRRSSMHCQCRSRQESRDISLPHYVDPCPIPSGIASALEAQLLIASLASRWVQRLALVCVLSRQSVFVEALRFTSCDICGGGYMNRRGWTHKGSSAISLIS
jgi:hypothetical protein